MGNPYFIDEPAAIGVSGGRSSAFMLYKIIEAHGGKLPEFVKPIFTNTGKEYPQTLKFLDQMSYQWGVDIIWLEYSGKKDFKVVNFGSANREGKPFGQLIKDRKMLPNPAKRFCSGELKVLTTERYMDSLGYGKIGDFTMAVGIRADEPRRVVKHRGKEGYIIPLVDDGAGKKDIKDFWDGQRWGLELPMMPDGSCYYTNCDLCFMKARNIKQTIIRDQGPEIADWWVGQEKEVGYHFRFDHPSYEQMRNYQGDQINMFDEYDESIPCFCGD